MKRMARHSYVPPAGRCTWQDISGSIAGRDERKRNS